MRLDIAIVSKTRSGFVAALRDMAMDIENGTTESNCFIATEINTVDYSFTDCNDVHEDNSNAKVVNLTPR